MEKSIFRSFRFKVILYCMLSLLFTFATEGMVLTVGYVVYRSLSGANVKTVIETMPENNFYSNNNIAGLNNLENLKNNQAALPVVKQEFSQTMLVYIIVAAFVSSVVLFILYFLILTKKFSDYLEEIGKGINELSDGNFDTRIPIKDQDELTDIARNLNTMAGNIKHIIESRQKTENTKNELITSVAHDLRTPLTSIIGYLDLVSGKSLEDATKEKYISIAYNKSKRLEKLINDLFTYTKFEFGEVKMSYASMDLVKMMEQMLDEFYPSFIENGLEYKLTTNESSVIIVADGDQLARAFANLIGNAIKYGASGKNINIRIQRKEERVSVAIINFGELIPKKDIDNIFDKFFRVDNSRNEELGGTGLGLAIAKSIIQLHKGTIKAKSDFSGTVFEVELPLNNEKKE